jgi:hypothetical protein
MYSWKGAKELKEFVLKRLAEGNEPAQIAKELQVPINMVQQAKDKQRETLRAQEAKQRRHKEEMGLYEAIARIHGQSMTVHESTHHKTMNTIEGMLEQSFPHSVLCLF